MDQRFLIRLRSGEAGGHTIDLSSCMPSEPRNTWVAWAECDGAFSCLNTRVFRRDSGMSSSHGIKTSFRRLLLAGAITLTPSGNLIRLTNQSPMIPAHNITPLLCCWYHKHWWLPLLKYNQPSGPSKVALVLSANKTHVKHHVLWSPFKSQIPVTGY